jgi:hypothetical protein
MTWTRLDNPKPPRASECPPDGVRFSARTAGGRAGRPTVPWIRVQIGKDAARKGSFGRTEHKVHILIGDGEEKGNLAIVCDDSTGKFKAKKQVDGGYIVSISSGAAEGRFKTAFEPFSVFEAKAIGNGQGPAFITFAVPSEFLAGKGK